MNKTKRNRFYKVAEARMNKIVSMIRLLANCSRKQSYEYSEGQVERIFNIIQNELNKAKLRFDNGGGSFTFDNYYSDFSYIDLSLPNGMCLRAVAVDDENFPGIDVYLLGRTNDKEKVCIVEFNPECDSPYDILTCLFNSGVEDPVYCKPYVPNEVEDEAEKS